MTVKTGQAWAGTFVTLDATGALEAGTPSGVLYVDGVADAATVTITGSNPYKFSVTLPTLTAGQRVDMYITATISTIATAGIVASEQADTLLLSDGVTLADDAIKASKFDESTAFPVKSADTGATAIARVGADSDTLETLSDQMDAIKAKTDNLPASPADEATLTAIKGAGWSDETLKAIYDSVDSLATAGDIADAVWDELLAGHVIPGSAGVILAEGTADISTVLALLSTSPSLLQQRCMNNDDLICRKSGDFVASFIYLGDLSGVTNLYFTIKPQTLVNSLPDNQATIQIQEGVGLLYINGGVAGVPANGSITITDAPAGHITINLDAVETAKLTANTKYRYDIKADHNILAEGAFFVQSAITLTV